MKCSLYCAGLQHAARLQLCNDHCSRLEMQCHGCYCSCVYTRTYYSSTMALIYSCRSKFRSMYDSNDAMHHRPELEPILCIEGNSKLFVSSLHLATLHFALLATFITRSQFWSHSAAQLLSRSGRHSKYFTTSKRSATTSKELTTAVLRCPVYSYLLSMCTQLYLRCNPPSDQNLSEFKTSARK